MKWRSEADATLRTRWRDDKTPQRFFSDSCPRRPPTIVAAQVTRRAPGPSFQFRHIPELDGFRGAAVSLVVLGHFLEFHRASEESAVRWAKRRATGGYFCFLS